MNLNAFLRLVRYKNLLIVAATQYLMRHAIISPILRINNFSLQLDEFHFFLLVLATVSITAAGYAINDYFDTRTDLLNRPGSVVVGRQIRRRSAIITHWILSLAGIALGIYLAFYIGVPWLGLVFPMVGGLLWFYSTSYNRQFLTGNLIIAFLTSMVPIMVVLFEIPLLNREYGEIMRVNNTGFGYLFVWVGSFGYFAFLTTLIRELIKDLEDYEGDRIQGRRSVPIVLGTGIARLIAGILTILTFTSLVYLYSRFLVTGFDGGVDYISLLYFAVFLLVPLLLLLFRLASAGKKPDYARAQSLTKMIMLTGLMYSVVVRFIIITSL